MHNFRELKIWKQGLNLAIEIFNLTKSFPETEKYGLVSQINRSAVSIPSNIAEGSARSTDKDFSRFLSVALGSSYELETQLIVGCKIGYLTEAKFDIIIIKLNELQKMINGFKKTLV